MTAGSGTARNRTRATAAGWAIPCGTCLLEYSSSLKRMAGTARGSLGAAAVAANQLENA